MQCASYREVKIHGVHPPAEPYSAVYHTTESDSAVSIILRSQASRCALHRGVKSSKFLKKLRGVSSVVCIILQSQASRCASYRTVNLHGVHDTSESSSACNVHHTSESNCIPRSQNKKYLWSLVAFKGTIRRNILLGVNTSKIKTEFANTLSCSAVAQMGSNHKKGGRKSRDTLPHYFNIAISL